jgi:hypothetical protein
MPVPYFVEILEVVEEAIRILYFVQGNLTLRGRSKNAITKPRKGNNARVRNRSGRRGLGKRKVATGVTLPRDFLDVGFSTTTYKVILQRHKPKPFRRSRLLKSRPSSLQILCWQKTVSMSRADRNSGVNLIAKKFKALDFDEEVVA